MKKRVTSIRDNVETNGAERLVKSGSALTEHSCFRSYLKRIGVYQSAECPTCPEIDEDVEHYSNRLRTCETVIFNIFKSTFKRLFGKNFVKRSVHINAIFRISLSDSISAFVSCAYLKSRLIADS